MEDVSLFQDILPIVARPDRPILDWWSLPVQVAGIFEWLYEVRHHRPLQRDLDREASGDRPAQRRLSRTLQDFWNLQAGRTFYSAKGDPDHWTIMKIGRHFGLAELKPNQLAACFDELCPCGTKTHSPAYLVKLRRKVIREFAGYRPVTVMLAG